VPGDRICRWGFVGARGETDVRIGLQIPSFTWPDGDGGIGLRLAEIGRTADEAGFASIWVMDHFFQIRGVGEPEEPMLEGYSALSYLAGVTQRAKLGTLVTGVVYRHPGILVKTVTALDVLSGGRAYLGIGAGWNEREALGLGVPFPSTRERFERLEETLRIATQMWSGEVKPYDGRHYHLAEPLNSPQVLSRPHRHCAIDVEEMGPLCVAPSQIRYWFSLMPLPAASLTFASPCAREHNDQAVVHPLGCCPCKATLWL
jgi:hypothetical protein